LRFSKKWAALIVVVSQCVAVLDANREEAQDVAYHEDLATWERILADGLEPSDVAFQ